MIENVCIHIYTVFVDVYMYLHFPGDIDKIVENTKQIPMSLSALNAFSMWIRARQCLLSCRSVSVSIQLIESWEKPLMDFKISCDYIKGLNHYSSCIVKFWE